MSSRRTSDGRVVRYLQLAHNVWDPTLGQSRTKVLHSFGREDELDRDAVKRLVTALSRLLGPTDTAAVTAPADLALVGSVAYGGTYVLDALWRHLGLDAAVVEALTGRRLDPRVERVLFALVANRALDASSKLAAAAWISADTHIEGLESTDEQVCYRAMDELLRIEPVLARSAYHRVVDLLNLEIDLLFFDTTSTYFEIDEPDPMLPRDEKGRLVDAENGVSEKGFRSHGKSKDSRDDLPQVVVGMAVTRDGIPVRVWTWPGATADSTLIRQARDEMREWTLSRVVWVADRGYTSAGNRRELMRGGTGYILGERLRSGSAEVHAALSRQGRYKTVRDNMQVKEVRLGAGFADDRFVICYNPEQADRDARIRERLVTQLEQVIAGTDRLSATERAKLEGQISTKPGLKRFLRTTATGLLRIDRARVESETKLDGKYLLRSSDPTLSAEDIALGYKQLLEVERGWRDLKQVIDLRPVFHRREDRIRAHVLLCWLALLLIRVAETRTGRTWNTMRADLQRLHAVTFTGPAGTFRRTTELTKPQRDLLTALDITAPKPILTLNPD